MADNRMFLVHVPTGLAVRLGKLTDPQEWKVAGEPEEHLDILFWTLLTKCQYEGALDDFAIALENTDHAPHAIEIEAYGEKRSDCLIHLVLKRGET